MNDAESRVPCAGAPVDVITNLEVRQVVFFLERVYALEKKPKHRDGGCYARYNQPEQIKGIIHRRILYLTGFPYTTTLC